jgi:hypothetical protein
MNIWSRSTALAGAILLWASVHVGAQIRQTVGLPPKTGAADRVIERSNHPVVLLHTRAGEFEGGERTVASLVLKRLDPVGAVDRVSPPTGVDGIIAYPGSRMLVIRGTKEAVAGYRAALEKQDGAPVEAGGLGKAGGGIERQPSLIIPEGVKLGLTADRVERAGDVTRASGHVVMQLGNGVELRAERIRATKGSAGQEIVIQK